MINYDKPVRMKSGVPVEILTTHLMGEYPVLGKSQGEYCIWKKDGSCLPNGWSQKDDLENAPEEREVWLNIYEDIICSSPTREAADNCHSAGRIARVKITLKDFEGKFDE